MAEHAFGKVRTNEVIAAKLTAPGVVKDAATYGGLAAAVAAIGNTPATVQFTTDATLTANLTVPATLELLPLNGAKIIHGTHTVNYLGSTARWPSVQIFSGSGVVTFAEHMTPAINPKWWATDADVDAGTQYVGPPVGSDTHFVGYRGGASGTPRFYLMPRGTGEANTTAAMKIFTADYYAEVGKASPTYEDIGLYYSKTDGAFAINSKATRKGSVSSLTCKPINVTFNDSADNMAASFFMQTVKGPAKTVTAATVGATTTLTAVAHGLTAPTWVWVEGVVGTLSALNDQWHLVSAVTTDTLTIDFVSTGLGYTSGGTVKVLANSPKPCALVGGTLPTATQFDAIGLYVNADAAVLYGKMWRFYNATNDSAGYGAKMNAANHLDFYNGSAVVASVTPYGIVNTPVSVPTVASAATIAPNALLCHVSGTTTISTITPPYSGFIGSITIIPDAVFATNTAGNIALASTAVVKKALIMTYDGTKWYPSY